MLITFDYTSNRKILNFFLHPIFALRSGLLVGYNVQYSVHNATIQYEKTTGKGCDEAHTCFSVFCILYIFAGPTPIQYLSISSLSKVASVM